MWWVIFLLLCYKFTAKSAGEKNLKIGWQR